MYTLYLFIVPIHIIRFYIILFRGKRAAALFRPSDRICGRDEKEELHRGEWHKRACVDVTHNKNDEEIASYTAEPRALLSCLRAAGRVRAAGKNKLIVAVM